MAMVWLDEPDEVRLYADRRSAGKYPEGVDALGVTSVRIRAWHDVLLPSAAAEGWTSPEGRGFRP